MYKYQILYFCIFTKYKVFVLNIQDIYTNWISLSIENIFICFSSFFYLFFYIKLSKILFVYKYKCWIQFFFFVFSHIMYKTFIIIVLCLMCISSIGYVVSYTILVVGNNVKWFNHCPFLSRLPLYLFDHVFLVYYIMRFSFKSFNFKFYAKNFKNKCVRKCLISKVFKTLR